MLRALSVVAAMHVVRAAVECTDPVEYPYLPTFHVLNNVSVMPNGGLHVEPLNDINAIFFYRGLYHVMCQAGGGNWTHAVSSDLSRWFRIQDALGKGAPNSSWDRDGPCDGTLSFPGDGNGPLILYGADCADKSLGLGDFPRVGRARAADPADPYLRDWIKGPENATFVGDPASFPGKVWRSEDGSHWNVLGALRGESPWARYTAAVTDDSMLNWTLADASFTKPTGIKIAAAAGDLFNPLPGAVPGGPTHMISSGTGNTFYLGNYDARLEQFNITSDLQYIDEGYSANEFFGDGPHWAATSNDFSTEPRVLWASWIQHAPSMISLTRSLTYDSRAETLVSFPVAEVAALRNETFMDHAFLALPPGAQVALPVPAVAGGALDLLASFVIPPGAVAGFGLAARAPATGPAGAAAWISFNVSAADARGVRNVTASGSVGPKPPSSEAPYKTCALYPGETLDVRLLVDRPVHEIFVNGGRISWAFADNANPFHTANASVWVFNHGAVMLNASSVSAFGMGCGWADELPAPRASSDESRQSH